MSVDLETNNNTNKTNAELIKAVDLLKSNRIIKRDIEIAEKTGYSRSVVSNYLSGRVVASENFLEAFKKAFPQLLSYVLKQSFVEESPELYVTESSPKQVIPLGKHVHTRLTPDKYKDAYGNWQGLPMYNEPITASFVATYRDEVAHRPQYYLHDPRFRDCNFGAVITGDSMHSEIRHGDFVACKEIEDYSFIVFGEIYYVIAKNGLETCKYVARMPKVDAMLKNGRYAESDFDNSKILLVPYNKSIDPSPLPINMITKMFKVRGIVTGY